MAQPPRTPGPLQRTSLPQQITDQLRNAIFDGQLPSGAVLRQSALAKQFGVSVIPLREALRRLEGEGLVRHEPHRGVVVADMSEDDLEELVQLSSALEGLAYSRALARIHDDDLQAAEAHLRALEEEREPTAFGDLAWELRRALFRRVQSPRLMQMLETLNRTNRRYHALIVRDPQSRVWVIEQWRKILALARKRDLAGLLAQIEGGKRDAVAHVRRLLPSRVAQKEGA